MRDDRPARYRRGLLMSKEQRATTPDLFQVCRRYFSEPVARVASEVLFWSQCGRGKLRGREGFYKEDADLVKAIGKDASSIRRALTRICAKVGEDRPEALFEIAHGPKPGQRSGRVRWLFRKPRGDEMIREALLLAEARREVRSASTNRVERHNRSGELGRTGQRKMSAPYIRRTYQNHIQKLSHQSPTRERKQNWNF